MARRLDDRDRTERRPNHRILGVLASSEATDATCEGVAKLGVDSLGIEVLHGEIGAAEFAARSRGRGWRAGIVQRFKELGGVDVEGMASYREALASGQYVVSVPVSAAHSLRPVVEVLQRHGARDLRYFGSGTMETIPDRFPATEGDDRA